MKNLLIVFIALIITGMFVSCRRNIPCANPGNYEIWFYTPSLADTMSDTSASIIRYAKGSNFIGLVDTVHGVVLNNLNVLYVYGYAQRAISYTAHSANIYNMDILITLHPSERVYKVTGMSHDNRTMTESKSQNYACTDDISYYVNGNPYQFAGQTFDAGGTGDAVLNIRY